MLPGALRHVVPKASTKQSAEIVLASGAIGGPGMIGWPSAPTRSRMRGSTLTCWADWLKNSRRRVDAEVRFQLLIERRQHGRRARSSEEQRHPIRLFVVENRQDAVARGHAFFPSPVRSAILRIEMEPVCAGFATAGADFDRLDHRLARMTVPETNGDHAVVRLDVVEDQVHRLAQSAGRGGNVNVGGHRLALDVDRRGELAGRGGRVRLAELDPRVVRRFRVHREIGREILAVNSVAVQLRRPSVLATSLSLGSVQQAIGTRSARACSRITNSAAGRQAWPCEST